MLSSQQGGWLAVSGLFLRGMLQEITSWAIKKRTGAKSCLLVMLFTNGCCRLAILPFFSYTSISGILFIIINLHFPIVHAAKAIGYAYHCIWNKTDLIFPSKSSLRSWPKPLR